MAEIDTWLAGLSLSEYSDNFKKAGITDLDTVKELTGDELQKEIGISVFGHRKKLTTAIEKLKSGGASAEGAATNAPAKSAAPPPTAAKGGTPAPKGGNAGGQVAYAPPGNTAPITNWWSSTPRKINDAEGVPYWSPTFPDCWIAVDGSSERAQVQLIDIETGSINRHKYFETDSKAGFVNGRFYSWIFVCLEGGAGCYDILNDKEVFKTILPGAGGVSPDSVTTVDDSVFVISEIRNLRGYDINTNRPLFDAKLADEGNWGGPRLLSGEYHPNRLYTNSGTVCKIWDIRTMKGPSSQFSFPTKVESKGSEQQWSLPKNSILAGNPHENLMMTCGNHSGGEDCMDIKVVDLRKPNKPILTKKCADTNPCCGGTLWANLVIISASLGDKLMIWDLTTGKNHISEPDGTITKDISPAAVLANSTNYICGGQRSTGRILHTGTWKK